LWHERMGGDEARQRPLATLREEPDLPCENAQIGGDEQRRDDRRTLLFGGIGEREHVRRHENSRADVRKIIALALVAPAGTLRSSLQ